MMKRRCVIAVLIGFWAGGALACCMVPATYEGRIGQDAQEAVLIHDEGREELVLRINYRITGEAMPDTFAWVITTPTEPDSYALADAKLFEDMFGLSQKLLVPKSRSFSKSISMDTDSIQGVELGRRVTVGPYDIQPIRGVGPNALKGLNTWLKNHGFPQEPEDHMTYFVENGFTFLCVRITPGTDESAVSEGGMLPPLHLSFASEQPYYPLRFSSRQGVFDVNIHLLTRKNLDYEASGKTLSKINWSSKRYRQNVKLSQPSLPESLLNVFRKSMWRKMPGSWRYNNIKGSQVNKGDTIQMWDEDVFFVTQ